MPPNIDRSLWPVFHYEVLPSIGFDGSSGQYITLPTTINKALPPTTEPSHTLSNLSGTSHQGTRPPRLNSVTFNGTWQGGVRTSDQTVVSELVPLVSDHENVFEIPFNGVGSATNLVDHLFGGKYHAAIQPTKLQNANLLPIYLGMCGWGTLSNVIAALKNLAQHHRLGDRLIIIGYSRGGSLPSRSAHDET